MKTYRGSPAAARDYVEAGSDRADDYYLAEGTGIAEHCVASRDGGVRELASLSGKQYEAWVAGVDPETGVAKGRLRHDVNAVRFVEVVVNGPKSWSLAAELHPDISAAYDAAQDSAARQIIGWLAQHATSRVGPRGAQVQAPVQQIEAAVVRHYTSRAGDPHRHLHLQINARVFAENIWRGLHTVGVRDSLDAINGIGHAAMMTDPGFRVALAGHGFTLDPDTGEVHELAEFLGPFSARTAQIGRNLDGYETDWRAAHPGREPGPALRRAWDARGWADARPDKVTPRDGAELNRRWVQELHELGYRDPIAPASIGAASIGGIDRVQAVGDVLSRLASRRSAWNGADVRGQVEQLIARRNVVTDAAIRAELAEDLTGRALAECVPLLKRVGVPEHIRALTSARVLEVEADLTARLAARANTPADTSPIAARDTVVDAHPGLDAAQRDAVRALVGGAQLVVIEGAAGAGKTSTLAATKAAIERHGARLIVVTPTLKAARVAGRELGTRAFSAAWLAHQHGWRWHDDGSWTRLHPGDTDPVSGAVFTGPSEQAMLRAGDLVLADEAGMLEQDTARALLTVADERGARVALVGDRHQLPAVGRGGVLDLAIRWAAPEAYLTLDAVHRFVRSSVAPDGSVRVEPDEQYAQLSLAMRAGSDPAAVFDTLLARGQISVHGSDDERRGALAAAAVDAITAGSHAVVIADTREQVAELNAAIRDRMIAAGRVEDQHVTITGAGERIGVGDRVATRRNNTTLGVANRDTWTVTNVAADGQITVSGERGERTVPGGYVRDEVELAYASTVHGVQGETATSARVSLGEHSSAASAYVALTRGREQNTAHLVANSIDDAREQWVAVFTRDWADLGPAHAADAAAHEASRYAQLRPLDDVLADLHHAWTAEHDLSEELERLEECRDMLTDILALTRDRDATVPPLQRAYDHARTSAEHATAAAQRAEARVSTHAAGIADQLTRAWDAQRNAARHAAQIVRAGPGRLGQRRGQVNRAIEELARWSAAWQPHLPTMPTRTEDIVAFAAWFDDTRRLHDHFHSYARQIADQAHPEQAQTRSDAQAAIARQDTTRRAYRDADRHYRVAVQHYGRLAHRPDLPDYLAELDDAIPEVRADADIAHQRVDRLLTEPTLRAQPATVIELARAQWHVDRDAARAAETAHLAAGQPPSVAHQDSTHRWAPAPSSPDTDHSLSIDR